MALTLAAGGVILLAHNLQRRSIIGWKMAIGLELVLLAGLALVHLLSPNADPLQLAQDGGGGGYVGWASIRLGQDAAQDAPAEWRLSLVFNTRDDGRVSQLYDQKLESMGFGLQLARLKRFEGEPAYFKMSVINLANGQIQAYKWFDTESDNLNLNLDWFQANLEPIDPADAPP